MVFKIRYKLHYKIHLKKHIKNVKMYSIQVVKNIVIILNILLHFLLFVFCSNYFFPNETFSVNSRKLDKSSINLNFLSKTYLVLNNP